MQLYIVLAAFIAGTFAAPSQEPVALPPCGVPPFLHMLPEEAQDKIKKIWENYKEGDSCVFEHGETKAILDALPPPPAPPAQPCSPPLMLDVLPEETRIGLKQIWEGYVEGQDCRDRQERTQMFLDIMNRKIMEKYHIPMPTPPCELPPFVDRLPAEAQEKVRAIWAEYKEGECSKEHEQTKAIIDDLPDDVKLTVLPPGPPPPIMPPPTNPNEPSPVGPPPTGDKMPDGPSVKLPPPPPLGELPPPPPLPPMENGVKPAVQPPMPPPPSPQQL